jgi:putative transposase
MYFVTKTIINPKHELYDYCSTMTALSKNIYNAALFRVRNIFTGFNKDSLSDLEQEVFDEVRLTENTFNCQIRRVISYNSLEKLMRAINNPDFFSGLPMQSSQAMVRKATTDFKNWLSALKRYKTDPSHFLGRPAMPHYLKSDKTTAYITNQDAVYKNAEIKLPLIKKRLPLPNVPENAILKEVKIKPYYNEFIILSTFEIPDVPQNSKLTHVASIDFGIENIVALITDEGKSFLYKGGAIKSCNQLYNKRSSKLKSIITKGHKNTNAKSKQLSVLSRNREQFINDQMHKISRNVIDICLSNNVGTIVLGINRGIKQHSNMGRSNNQSFVSVPISRLAFMITYKAQRAGITVIEQEESYTSKADFLSNDLIPVYGKEKGEVSFSGSRIKRGLYKSATGRIINADINGAANIMCKAGFTINDKISNMINPVIIGFKELNSKSIPVEGIVAV